VRGWIYDATVSRPLTAGWYGRVLDRIGARSTVLDVGIGTGGALAANADRVRALDLRVTGVDVDNDYVSRCRQNLLEVGLADRVAVCHQSILDHRGGPYDAAYFSASFMVMPDPVGVLRHVLTLLAPGGGVYFTQTFHDRRSPMLEKAKPLLKRVTTIEFGRVTYEEDFRRAASAGGLELTEVTTMKRSGGRSYRLVVGKPAGSAMSVAAPPL
jgi:tRNA A58 N-methylase Trm61